MTRPHEFPAPVKREKWQQCTGADGVTRCEGCTAALRPGKYRFDHRKPVWFGGDSTIDNCQLICTSCDAPKTYQIDIPRISKTKRQLNGFIGHRSRSGRPLPASRSDSLKRKMDGTVVDRRTGEPVGRGR